MKKSAIILAGGGSSRLGQEKGLVRLSGKPLIEHVLDRVDNIADEKSVIVGSKLQRDRYSKVVGPEVNILVDLSESHNPLAGAAAGLEATQAEYAALLPCDTPFLSREILDLLFDLVLSKNAAIPRWPNCFIEPLQATYRTKAALSAAKIALSAGKCNIQAMVEMLHGIRYVSTLVLEQLDSELRTFFNINTVLDLRKAENMLKRT